MPTSSSNTQAIQTTCCIAGGGPAGMMLGFLLARAGVDVQVLEKHADFLRDFRGDTIHPSTFELMYELGILEDFLRRPHQELTSIAGVIDNTTVTIADFSHLPTHCKFVGLMPQWDFLNFVAEKARAYPEFHLRMESEVTDLILENGRVVGVRAKTKQGALEIRADLTVGADGRHSTVRKQAGLEVIDLGAPIDVLWMRIPRDKTDPEQTLGRFHAGKILVMLNRGDYWQCAYVIAKGTFDEMKRARLAGLSQGPLGAGSISWQSNRSPERLERYQLAFSFRGSLARLVANRTSLHRRLRACHVARWRRRHQSRDSRCRRRCERAGTTAARPRSA